MTPPADLIDRISSARRSSFVGVGYRQLAPSYDPLSGEGARIHGGRFNPADSFPVLYLCSTPGCAAAELTRFAQRNPIGVAGFLPRSLYRYDIEFTSVLDLTSDDTLDYIGVARRQLVDEDRGVTHEVGEICHQFGYQAVVNGSVTGVGEVLAVFVENLRSGRLDASFEAAWESKADLPVF